MPARGGTIDLCFITLPLPASSEMRILIVYVIAECALRFHLVSEFRISLAIFLLFPASNILPCDRQKPPREQFSRPHKSNSSQGENFPFSPDQFDACGRSSVCDSIRWERRVVSRENNSNKLDCLRNDDEKKKKKATKPDLLPFMVHVEAASSLFPASLISPHKMTNDLICCRSGLSGHHQWQLI